MGEVMATVELAEARDGSSQLQRRWSVDGCKASLLLVHGIGEHSGRYLHIADFFASRGFDVAAFDNRGFGQSGGPRAHIDSFEVFLDDIEDRLAERASLGKPTFLLGHSLGGLMVTAYLVSDRPQPDFAILSSPALSAEVPRWQRIAAPILGRVAPKTFVPSKIDGIALSRDVEVQKAYVDDPLVIAGATAGFGNEVFTVMDETSNKIESITLPTYVLHGDQDEVVPQASSKPLAGLDNVTYRSWNGLRHECFNEPEQIEVMTEVADWMDDQLTSQ